MAETCVECGQSHGLRLRNGETTCGRCAYGRDAAFLVSLQCEMKRIKRDLEAEENAALLNLPPARPRRFYLEPP